MKYIIEKLVDLSYYFNIKESYLIPNDLESSQRSLSNNYNESVEIISDDISLLIIEDSIKYFKYYIKTFKKNEINSNLSVTLDSSND